MPEIIDQRVVYSGWLTLSQARVRMDDGRIAERLVEDHGRGVAVLPFDADKKTAILVRQFRTPPHVCARTLNLLEVIAGLADGEPPETAAAREALEEAGLKLSTLEHVATVWTMPGISTERMDLFFAPYSESDRVGPGGGRASEHEDITVLEIPLADLASMVDAGDIADMKTYALIQALRLRRPTLF
jgi:nudix-type nucleoside diphosphatase (YffH/AdpP family)